MRCLALNLLFVLLGAQDPSPVPTPPTLLERQGAAMGVLRDRRSELAEVEVAVEELLTLSSDSCVLLGRHLERVLKRERKHNARGQEEMLKAFIRSANRLLAERLEGEGQERVDGARRSILQAARSKGLAKDTIKKVSQPALEFLQEILLLRPAQVWDSDEEVFDQWVVHLDALDLEVLHFSWLVRARDELLRLDKKRAAEAFKDQGDPRRFESELFRDLDWEATLTTPMTPKDREVLESNRRLAPPVDGVRVEETGEPQGEPKPGSRSERTELPEPLPALNPEESRGIFALNRLRILLGLNALHADLALCAAARDHSEDMVKHGFFAHDSPVSGRETPWKRAAARGSSAGAENIAAGQRTGEGATRAWWFSPGHHKNMLRSATRCGLGNHRSHWTQLLGG